MTPDPADRAWPPPARPWIMAQTWHDLLFAHWPVPVEALRPLVPRTLAIDTLDGQAWLGVVPFHMTGVRLRACPPLPGLSAFPELNVRTYVTTGERPGVWFLSLDAGNALAVTAARRWFHLPYYRARMDATLSDHGVVYRSRRVDHRGAPAEFASTYGPAGHVFHALPGSLERWLTARYCLYAEGPAGRLYRAEIDHLAWPLQPAAARIEQNTMALAHGIRLPSIPPLLHFARRLDVRVWSPERLSAAA